MAIRVRVGQQNAVRVISSTATAITRMQDINDVDTINRGNRTLLMFDGQNYIHVDPAKILDLSDNVEDGVVDYGNFWLDENY